MIDYQDDRASLRKVRYALAQLDNIIGCKIAVSLPPPGDFSLPSAIDGLHSPCRIPGSTVLTTLNYFCEGGSQSRNTNELGSTGDLIK